MHLLHSFVVGVILLMSCANAPSAQPAVHQEAVARPLTDTVQHTYKRKAVASLTQEEISQRVKANPCYLPLLASNTIWQKEFSKGFRYQDLLNSELPKGHPYAQRYLVGDFNVVDLNGRNKGVEEIYPHLSGLQEFSTLPPDLLSAMEAVRYGTSSYDSLLRVLPERLGDQSGSYTNFLEKVWKYRMVPIKREYSILNEHVFYAGQSIVMCEACGDTLVMQGRFATSAKGHNSPSKNGASGNFPVQKRRPYYAGLNFISQRNWERARKYEDLDIKRDREMGGGSKHITHFKGKVELPNFLLIDPTGKYPDAMHSNGIHEVALRELARGMLGTANSLGCLRVSDFGSKFLRWWVPQNARLFITYEDDKYHRKADSSVSVVDLLPFKNVQEGNAFRKWINQFKPLEAKILEIKEEGDYKNGYILDGYYYFKDEYAAYLREHKSNVSPSQTSRQ